MNILQDIDKAKHIVIEFDFSLIFSASALYTHILRLHKKVSLVCISEDKDNKLSFLPWFEKIKYTKVLSADLTISLDVNATQLYEMFKENEIKLNQKMATALYAGLLQETNGFKNSTLSGTTFAFVKELIDYGAEFKMCHEKILKSTTLNLLRLKAVLLKNMQLQKNATLAVLYISDDILKATGSKEKDAYMIMNEVICLPHVKEVSLLKLDEKNKVLKIIKKEL
jgi:phosphoesterase RecJ-like protein